MNRYLLDTNIFVYAVEDRDILSADVLAILEDYESVFYMSAESIKELIVAFRNKKLLNEKWATPSRHGSLYYRRLLHNCPADR